MKRAGRLSLRWSKAREHGRSALNSERGDVLYEWGDGCHKADGGLLHFYMATGHWNLLQKRSDQSLLEQLHERGYDLTTIKFSIQKREKPDVE